VNFVFEISASSEKKKDLGAVVDCTVHFSYKQVLQKMS
jgi:hypothetical protein